MWKCKCKSNTNTVLGEKKTLLDIILTCQTFAQGGNTNVIETDQMSLIFHCDLS